MIEARESTFVGDVVFSPETAHDMYRIFAHFHARTRIEPEDFEFVLL